MERWFGIEVLGHDAGHVDLGANGGAVLMDHDHRDQVGVVEQVEIDGNEPKVALWFALGKVQEPKKFIKTKSGIRQNVSVATEHMEAERTAVEMTSKLAPPVGSRLKYHWCQYPPSIGGHWSVFEERIESKQEDKCPQKKINPKRTKKIQLRG
ncbi:hypothetical protein THIOSC15_3450014 [uncultured Thiomicrorhabdus sp.]